jgi:hypothetical protein
MAVLVAILTIILKLPRKPKDLVIRAQAIVKAMTGNSWFATPNPTLASVTTAVDALDAAILPAAGRPPGATQALKDKQADLISLLKHLADYVLGIAEQSPGSAITIVQSAAMYVLGHTVAPKPDLAALDGAISGQAVLRARAGKPRPTTHYWQSSLNQKDWLSAPDTTHATTTIGNLTPGQVYYFRHASMRKNVRTDWSQVVSLLVK